MLNCGLVSVSNHTFKKGTNTLLQHPLRRMGLSLENVLDTVNMELVFNVVTAAMAMAGAWVIFQDGFPM